jgi:hypothetical protein
VVSTILSVLCVLVMLGIVSSRDIVAIAEVIAVVMKPLLCGMARMVLSLTFRDVPVVLGVDGENGRPMGDGEGPTSALQPIMCVHLDIEHH